MKTRSCLSLLLAVMLLFSVVMPAYAEVSTGESIAAQQAVPVVLKEDEAWTGREDTSVLGIEVSWKVDTIEFMCTTNYGVKWNPSELRFEKDYDNGSSVGSRTSNSFSSYTLNIGAVTNRSLCNVTVTPSFTPVDELKDTDIAKLFAFAEGPITLTAATANENMFDVGSVGATKHLETAITDDVSDIYEVYNIIKENNLTSIGTINLTVARAS